MLDPFSLLPFQRAVAEILLLAVGAGILGTWVVLRGLAFFTHGVATATFPGLVLADGLGFAAPLGALGVALLFVVLAGRRAGGAAAVHAQDEQEHDTTTAMLLVGAMVVGVILASDVFRSATGLNGLLFGSLLVVDGTDLVIAGVASALVLAATAVLGPRWLARGLDPAAAGGLGLRSRVPDAVLLALVAGVAVAALSAVGSLLAAALVVVPAATTRPWVARVPVWQATTVVLTAALGVVGLWISFQTNAPPGAGIGVVAGLAFVLSVGARALVSALAGRTVRSAHAPGATA